MARRWIECERFIRWVFVDQAADLNRGVGLFEGERAAAGLGIAGSDSVTRCAEVASIGAMIKGSRAADVVHPDADLALGVLMEKLTRRELGLIGQYARRGSRPPAGECGVYFEPVYRETAAGRLAPKIIYDANRKPRFCLVECKTSLARVESERKLYSEWHAALIAAYFGFCQNSERFSEIRVSFPEAPAPAW